jgi:hypothetical protein
VTSDALGLLLEAASWGRTPVGFRRPARRRRLPYHPAGGGPPDRVGQRVRTKTCHEAVDADWTWSPGGGRDRTAPGTSWPAAPAPATVWSSTKTSGNRWSPNEWSPLDRYWRRTAVKISAWGRPESDRWGRSGGWRSRRMGGVRRWRRWGWLVGGGVGGAAGGGEHDSNDGADDSHDAPPGKLGAVGQSTNSTSLTP